MVTVGTALGIINWCLNCIGILLFLWIFNTFLRSRRELRDVSTVLTMNTCVAALLTCLAIWVMDCSNLTTGFLTYNHTFCCIWGLIYDVFACSIYHSYYLQAIYRLCRVVFYKKTALLSYSLYIKAIFGQWFLTITVLLPPIFLNWYAQLGTEKYCLVPYTNVLAETYHIVILYLIPLVCMGIVYVWITTFIRRTSRAASRILVTQQRQRNIRDLTILRRIIFLMTILICLRFPTVIFMIHAIIIGSLYPYTFGIVGFITCLCLILIGSIIIHITPSLRKNVSIGGYCISNQVVPQSDVAILQPESNRALTTR